MPLSNRQFLFKQLIILFQFYNIVNTIKFTHNTKQLQVWPTTNDTVPTVTISQGTLLGSKAYTQRGTEYYRFLGIPYAKPPLGVLRFKDPEPPETWEGVRDSRTVSKSQVCSQTDSSTNQVIGNEDCLYLNVYTPQIVQDKESKLPVMFGINSGGFHGNGATTVKAGLDYLLDEDVVVVDVTYRLGILGFISTDNEEASGNIGLKDQAQALNWVQENIDKFGGDRNNVTIFGIV